MTQTQGEYWKDLLVAAQQGDKRAYHQFLTEISVYIRKSIYSGLANPDWADDITQDVLVSVHKSLHTYSPDRPVKPWLMAIVGFRRTDFLRKHYKNRDHQKTPLDDVDFQKQHVTNPDHWGELKDIENALGCLPQKQRKIFKMFKIEGYTAQEVADQMKMSVSAVKVSAHRTQNKLIKMIKKRDG